MAITKAFKAFRLRDIIIGITILPCPSLNYLILIGKLFMGLQKKNPRYSCKGGGGLGILRIKWVDRYVFTLAVCDKMA